VAKKPEPVLTADQQRLAAENTGLVGGVLRNYFWYVVPGSDQWDDWYAEGLVALCRAAHGFRPDAGWKFSTYASVAVMRYLLRYKEVEGRRGFRMVGERRPQAAQMADDGWKLVADGRRPEPAGDPFGLGDLEPLVRRLRPDRQLAIRAAYQEGQTGTQIGARLGTSKTWADQLRKDALAELREAAGATKAA
jgi:RNA polymerase sigma factor (sigma-70 family)